MRRGFSARSCLGQVPNFLPKKYFYHKHGPFHLDAGLWVHRAAVLLSEAYRGPPAGLLRPVPVAGPDGVDTVPNQARFTQLSQANSRSPGLTNRSVMRRHSSTEIPTVARNAKRRRCNYRRSVRQRINRRYRQGSCEYSLKKFTDIRRLRPLTSLAIVEYRNVFDFDCFA